MIQSFTGRYRFLSNFYLCEITVAGITYPSVEHAFQSMKTFNEVEKLRIKNCLTPSDAKFLGKRVKMRPDWDLVKDQVMYDLVKQKFSRHERLKERLLETGETYLIEGNRWNDTYWGVCRGVGKNKLGVILMRVRKELAG